MAVFDRTAVIVGANIFGESILKALKDSWNIICIDIDENLINSLKEKYSEENIIFVEGDASSLLTWKKIKKIDENIIEKINNIIITVRDPDVALETCRVTTEVLNIKANIFVLLFYPEKKSEFLKFENVEILEPTELITKILLTKIEKNYSIAINIGLRQGEIIEINVLARSHLVDRKLKYLKATRWRIAAIYRNGKLIIPTGNEKIKIGDKVVIVGDPKVLQNLVELFTKGVPQFPQQFGANIAVPYNSLLRKTLEEAVYIKKNSQAHAIYIYPLKEKVKKEDIYLLTENFEIKSPINSLEDLLKIDDDIGLYVYPLKKSLIPFYHLCKLRKVFKLAKKPFLLSSGKIPYKKIVISLNCPDPAFVLSIGIELSRLMKIPYEVIYVTLPKELRGIEEENELKERKEIVKDYEQIYKKKIKFEILEGNPVKETVKYTCKETENTLFVVAYDKEQKISFFEPHVPFLIVKKLTCSSLVIPLGSEEIYG